MNGSKTNEVPFRPTNGAQSSNLEVAGSIPAGDSQWLSDLVPEVPGRLSAVD